jgi:hypothetical protein
MATVSEEPGSLSVLNCGYGDIEIRFDEADEAMVAKACEMIEDMLKRGYVIAVKDEAGEWQRVTAFDRKHLVCYVREAPKKGKPGRKKGVPLKSTKAVGVAPTAGG